ALVPAIRKKPQPGRAVPELIISKGCWARSKKWESVRTGQYHTTPAHRSRAQGTILHARSMLTAHRTRAGYARTGSSTPSSRATLQRDDEPLRPFWAVRFC